MGVSGTRNIDAQLTVLATNSISDTVYHWKSMDSTHSVIMPTPTNMVTTDKYSGRYLVGHTSAKYKNTHDPEPAE